VCLGGLHVTSLPEEAAPHADSIFLGPGDHSFALFLRDFRRGQPKPRYDSGLRDLTDRPATRRDLIKRHLYLVPNSLVVSRGCPHHCDFCYKDAFYKGGRSFYTQRVDEALAEIDRLPGRHLYFLDDHLLADPHFARAMFEGMRGMRRLFQGTATIDSILRGDLIERAAEAGLRSLFVGFETLSPENLRHSNKRQNLGRKYERAIRRLDDLGVMINGSFVFGMDEDRPDVFSRTVDWAVEQGITTATFHILTPYPGTKLFQRMELAWRLLTRDWDRYDTRHAVHRPRHMTAEQLEQGYRQAYKAFYGWSAIVQSSRHHQSARQGLKHLAYAAGWKRFEWLWGMIIKAQRVAHMRPLLEALLASQARGLGVGSLDPKEAEAASPTREVAHEQTLLSVHGTALDVARDPAHEPTDD